jgi:hypothetical protein
MVSPETILCVSPCLKLMCAASASIQRLVCLPNSLGERCKSSRKASRPPLRRRRLRTRNDAIEPHVSPALESIKRKDPASAQVCWFYRHRSD